MIALNTVEDFKALERRVWHVMGTISGSSLERNEIDEAMDVLSFLLHEVEGPNGFPSWKAAAINERLKRVNLELENK